MFLSELTSFELTYYGWVLFHFPAVYLTHQPAKECKAQDNRQSEIAERELGTIRVKQSATYFLCDWFFVRLTQKRTENNIQIGFNE